MRPRAPDAAPNGTAPPDMLSNAHPNGAPPPANAALQVICLGAGGGPSEENVTGYLVRSVARDWARGSLLAVDAGSHLASIVRILERDFPSVSEDVGMCGEYRNGNGNGMGNGDFTSSSLPSSSPEADGEELLPPKPDPVTLTSGPFAGLKFPNESARANALHVIRNYVNTYLITHPHLDHLSGFAINTAAFHATSRPKTLAALPSTVDAVKAHIFNDIIWPNLTDEDGGVGFVTFQRLKEGGDVMVGEGEGRGYIDVSDGLGVKAFKVSHGVCTKSPPSHQHRGSIAGLSDSQSQYPPTTQPDSTPSAPAMARQVSMSQFSAPGTPGGGGSGQRPSFYATTAPPNASPRLSTDHAPTCVVDSTAYFIRDTESSREILFFGDIEPDAISLTPRNHLVWAEAARKLARGLLGGVFIECSYDDSQADAFLFGHLNPKHLIAELQTLAALTVDAKAARAQEKGARKRKRSAQQQRERERENPHHPPSSLDAGSDRKRSRSLATRALDPSTPARRPSFQSDGGASPSRPASPPEDALTQIQNAHTGGHGSASGNGGADEPVSPKTARHPLANGASASFPSSTASVATTAPAAPAPAEADPPLAGLKVVIIHVKDTLKDGPHVQERILGELRDYEDRLGGEGGGGSGGKLGCSFELAVRGGCVWF